MEYTENVTGIKINVQAVDISIEDDIKDTIRKIVTRLSRFSDKIHWADIYLEDKTEKATQQKQVNIRLGVPGNDPFASNYGDNFHTLLTDVEDKLRRQLEKL